MTNNWYPAGFAEVDGRQRLVEGITGKVITYDELLCRYNVLAAELHTPISRQIFDQLLTQPAPGADGDGAPEHGVTGSHKAQG